MAEPKIWAHRPPWDRVTPTLPRDGEPGQAVCAPPKDHSLALALGMQPGGEGGLGSGRLCILGHLRPEGEQVCAFVREKHFFIRTLFF